MIRVRSPPFNCTAPAPLTPATVSSPVRVKVPALLIAAPSDKPPPSVLSAPEPSIVTLLEAIVPDNRTDPPTDTLPAPESDPAIVPLVSVCKADALIVLFSKPPDWS